MAQRNIQAKRTKASKRNRTAERLVGGSGPAIGSPDKAKAQMLARKGHPEENVVAASKVSDSVAQMLVRVER